MKRIIRVGAIVIVALALCVGTLFAEEITVVGFNVGSGGATAANEKPAVVLQSVQIGTRSVRFYVDFGTDSAVLGFSVENDSGQQRYFLMYGSTYRGLPPVVLDVFVSHCQEEMWVRSSWSGYEVLAYHRMGTNRCITRYGEITSFDKPTPASLGEE